MRNFERYNKAIYAILTNAVVLGAGFGLRLEINPVLLGTIATVLTGLLVYLVPNKP